MKTNNTRNAFNQCPYIFDLSVVPRVVNNESKYPPIYMLQYYCNLEMQYEKSIKAVYESRVNMPAPKKYKHQNRKDKDKPQPSKKTQYTLCTCV